MELKGIILILATFSLNICSTQASPIQPFIVNGTDATIQEFPFIASLRNTNRHACGCTIINEWWILTAAHCVFYKNVTLLSVHIGSTYLDDENPQVIPVDFYVYHAGYNPLDMYINDIAVIKLQRPLRTNLFDWKVRLPANGAYYPTGTPAVLAGWGRNATEGVAHNTLQKVDLQIYSAIDCAELHAPRKVHPTSICGGVEGGYKGQCSGPLFVRGIQVGIVSWSVKPCTVPPYPGVYTSVAHYIDWIEEQIGFSLNVNVFMGA